MEGICVSFLDPVHFFRFLKGCCHDNQFYVVSKMQTTCDFQFLHHIKAFWVYMTDLKFFFQYLKGSCHGNQFSGKNGAKLPTPCTYYCAIPKRNGISQPEWAR